MGQVLCGVSRVLNEPEIPMPMECRMATWEQVHPIPTLYPRALLLNEGEQLHWHADANQPRSWQVFCGSAFGTLRLLPVQDCGISQWLGVQESPTSDAPVRSIELEADAPACMPKAGQSTPYMSALMAGSWYCGSACNLRCNSRPWRSSQGKIVSRDGKGF